VALGIAFVVGLGACDVAPEEENRIGDEYAAQAQQSLTVVTDGEISGYVDSLARRIVAVADGSNREQRDWHVYVVDDSTVNAFAIPGGHIFVHGGLIERAAAMDELAGVLGHEIAHVTLRHSVDQMKKQGQANVVVTLVCSVTGWCASDVARVAINVGGAALFAKYSREDEREADSAAVNYLVEAGIDPRGIPRMFERLMAERSSAPTVLDAWFGSHPLESDRVERSKALVSQYEPSALDRLTSQDTRFREVQARLRGQRDAVR